MNTTDSAVRITHIPTGIVVACQQERSQHKNKAVALKVLQVKIEHLEKMKKDQKLKELYGDKGEIAWGLLAHSRAVRTIRNPRYAGAFVFGRTKSRKHADGSLHIESIPLDEWDTVIPDAHPGYITWQEYNDNLKTLQACAKTHGTDRRDHPPGEGPALLQGLILCGVCGRRMTVGYHKNNGETVPDYVCQYESKEYGVSRCQTFTGSNIDKAIGELFDPSIHEVLSQIESPDHEENIVIEEYSKGYSMNGRVLIPSRVVIAKKPAKIEPDDKDKASTESQA